jgi:hypothetical protein
MELCACDMTGERAYLWATNQRSASRALNSAEAKRRTSMSLDPDAERVLEIIRASGRPPTQSLLPQEAREVYRVSRKVLTPDPPMSRKLMIS